MGGVTVAKTMDSTPTPSTPLDARQLGVHYHGTKRLPNLPDGRHVFEVLVGARWTTYYEVPLTETDLRTVAARQAPSGPAPRGVVLTGAQRHEQRLAGRVWTGVR
jgi:hypothetical protein